MAIVVPPEDRRELVLYELDQQAGTLHRIEWPESWAPLAAQMLMRAHGEGPPPTLPVDSLLIELPVGEREWMIFELDERYVTASWLPDLLAMSFPDEGERRAASATSCVRHRRQDRQHGSSAALLSWDRDA